MIPVTFEFSDKGNLAAALFLLEAALPDDCPWGRGSLIAAAHSFVQAARGGAVVSGSAREVLALVQAGDVVDATKGD